MRRTSTYAIRCVLAVFPFCAAHATLDQLIPAATTAGGPGFILRAIGDFESDEFLLWNGMRLNTTFISGSELRASITAEMIRSPGEVTVTLAGFNSRTFTINPPLAITTASPAVRLVSRGL
jgi:hypothetical protein